MEKKTVFDGCRGRLAGPIQGKICLLRRGALAACVFLALGAAGCRTAKAPGDMVGPRFSPSNYAAAPAMPAGFQRVAVLPFYYDGPRGDWLDDLEAIFRAELVKSGRFEVVPVGRSKLREWTGRSSLTTFETVPGELFDRIEREYAVDGVLFTDLTRHSPYRPVAIGIRTRLVLGDGRTIWAFDELFDSGRPDVARAARVFSTNHVRQDYPLDAGSTILQSPDRFGKYVAHATYETLPER